MWTGNLREREFQDQLGRLRRDLDPGS